MYFFVGGIMSVSVADSERAFARMLWLLDVMEQFSSVYK